MTVCLRWYSFVDSKISIVNKSFFSLNCLRFLLGCPVGDSLSKNNKNSRWNSLDYTDRHTYTHLVECTLRLVYEWVHSTFGYRSSINLIYDRNCLSHMELFVQIFEIIIIIQYKIYLFLLNIPQIICGIFDEFHSRWCHQKVNSLSVAVPP